MPIRALPTLLVNQIAAGEVIERPASVVKECVENAIDAGASRIDIVIEVGGKELIRISDDGDGIPEEELELAIAPHATSKITQQDDLDAIATMGFRGEALASIASVSRMSIVSRPREQPQAAVIEVEGEKVHPVRPAAGPPGTTVTVRNLFFNTPARRKFLRTDQTESGRIGDLVDQLALAHPAIAFRLRIDGRTTLDVPAEELPRRRAVAILGPELDQQLIELRTQDRGIDLWGLIGRPEIARSNAKHLRTFLNGRMINDRSLMHAVREAYRGLIEPSRFPTVVLFLQMDPAQVDVNVHPAKAEVRFRNQGSVHGMVLSAVRRVLREHDLTPEVQFGRGNDPASHLALPRMPTPEFGAGNVSSSSTGSGTPRTRDDDSARFVEYFRQLNPTQKGFIYSEVKQALRTEMPELVDESDDTNSGDRLQPGAAESAREESLPSFRSANDVMQVHSSFLVTQDEEGLLIIDQHALHERVMFEKLKERMAAGPLESQRLLLPATVTVDRDQVDLLESLRPLLARLGIEAEPIGPTSIAVHAFTSLLFSRKVEPEPFLKELFDKASGDGLADDSEAALHEVLDMMACKAAIKAGDRMTPDELQELLRYREKIERASNCPHGRPTSLRLSIRDLEKQFGRS